MTKKKRKRQTTPGDRTSKKPSQSVQEQHHSQKQPWKKSGYQQVSLFFLVLVSVLGVSLGFTSIWYALKGVTGYGMLPTLNDRDVLVVKKRPKEFKRFALVVYNDGRDGQLTRIIGKPGEEIDYRGDQLYVNQQEVDEKFLVDRINEAQKCGIGYTADFSSQELSLTLKIPPEYYLVLGDNRPYVTDSREYGLVHQKYLQGQVVARIWPIEIAQGF